MINKIKTIKTIESYNVESITCDKCKKTYSDIFDIQEFHHINFIGGYVSIFGYENKIEADICNSCFYEMINNFCRINGIINKK